jgi:hypothetical protein
MRTLRTSLSWLVVLFFVACNSGSGKKVRALTPRPITVLALHGSGPNDVWAVGYRDDNAVTTPMIEHYDGSVWTEIATPIVFEGVWALRPDLAHAVGGVESDGLVYVWDGAAWTQAHRVVNDPDVYGNSNLHSVWASAPNDVWVAGGRGIYRFDGQQWAFVYALQSADLVMGTSPSDVWASARYGGDLHHFDGSTWKRVPTEVDAGSLWSIAPAEVWAGPQGQRISVQGTQQTLPGRIAHHAVWGTKNDDLWAFEHECTKNDGALIWRSCLEYRVRIVHWNGRAWSVALDEPYGEQPVPFVIWGSSSDDVWFFADGILAHHPG